MEQVIEGVTSVSVGHDIGRTILSYVVIDAQPLVRRNVLMTKQIMW